MSEGALLETIENVVKTTPYTIYQAGLLAWLVTGDSRYGMFTLLTVVFGEMFNHGEKYISKLIMKPSSVAGQRPSNCPPGKDTCIGCGIYPSVGAKKNGWGMPSGHAQITSFAAMYWTLFIWLRYDRDEKKKKGSGNFMHTIVSMGVIWALVTAVCAQRVVSKCHSILQVIIGAIIGSLLAFVGYYISTEVYSDMPKLFN
jgi:membrane-associated phospholipid phosphatase